MVYQRDPFTNRAEVVIDGRTFVLGFHMFEKGEATVFCKSLNQGFQYGDSLIGPRIPGSVREQMLMDFIQVRRNPSRTVFFFISVG